MKTVVIYPWRWCERYKKNPVGLHGIGQGKFIHGMKITDKFRFVIDSEWVI